MTLGWRIWSPRHDVPPHPDFRSLQEVRDFLKAQGVSLRDDKQWRAIEVSDGTKVAECAAGVLMSDQGAHWKTILEGTLP
jgi:hypothetical protein